MILTEDVTELFSIYSGVTEPLPYMPLILSAVNEIECRLKNEEFSSDKRIVACCAALANLRYCEATAARDGLSHTYAGNVAQNHNASEKISLALALWKASESACHSLLTDEDFTFIAAGENYERL